MDDDDDDSDDGDVRRDDVGVGSQSIGLLFHDRSGTVGSINFNETHTTN